MKETIMIPVTPYPGKIEEWKQDKNIKEYAIYRASFAVEKEYLQLVISFQAQNIRWFTCNVYHEKKVRGQAVQIMKKPMETIYIGSEIEFNSATFCYRDLFYLVHGNWNLKS